MRRNSTVENPSRKHSITEDPCGKPCSLQGRFWYQNTRVILPMSYDVTLQYLADRSKLSFLKTVVECHLDARRATAPSAAAVGAATVAGLALVVANPEESENGRHEPADCRQEGKGDDCLPVAALVYSSEVDALPVEDVAARSLKSLDNQAKGNKPTDGDEEVDGPVDEAAGEGEQPEEREKDGKASDDFSVDEACLFHGAGALDGMEVGAIDTSDDAGKDQLRNAQENGKDISQHLVGF